MGLIQKIKNTSKSKFIIVLIAASWIATNLVNKPWENNVITNDVVSYYGYLPAAIIYKDLSLKFTEKDSFFADKFWPNTAPNGGKVIKMSMGLSMMYAPFFMIAHVTAPLLGAQQDGYSQHYQIFVWLSTFFYLLLGFIYLRKILLLYFSENITSLTILSVYFGTNLLWYSTLDGLMSHGYLFTLLIIFLYHTIKWHNAPNIKTAIYIGLIGGLITLIRPTMMVCFFIFLFYNLYNKQTLIEKFKLFKGNALSLFLIVLGFIVVLSPQLFYWKYITGDWLFFSYVGETFYFDNPHIIDGLFGFRKGWLIYTPIMIFAIFGFLKLRKRMQAFGLAISIPFLVSIYIILSWWCWWYGGSFGQRPFVDFYGLLAIPMALFYKELFENKNRFLKGLFLLPIILLIALNLFQTRQFYKGLIHFDSMTKESYLSGFFATHNTFEWYQTLEEPDYERVKNGKPELIDYYEINQLNTYNRISLKALNLKNATCEANNGGFVTSSRFDRGAWEKFEVIYQGHNKIALKAVNEMYVSADKDLGNKLVANRPLIGGWETFELIYLGNNRIALKAWNGKFVSVNMNDPNDLNANSEFITTSEIFRLFIFD